MSLRSPNRLASTYPPPQYPLPLGNMGERHPRRNRSAPAQALENTFPGWLLTLTLFGFSGFAVGSLPRLVVVERGAVLAVGPGRVVLAHAFPMDLGGGREQGSPTAKPKESPGHEQYPCTGDAAPATRYYVD